MKTYLINGKEVKIEEFYNQLELAIIQSSGDKKNILKVLRMGRKKVVNYIEFRILEE